MNVYIWSEFVLPTESIAYKMNADSSGNLYVPIGGTNYDGSYGKSYSWKVSIDGGAETTYTGVSINGGSITLSGYTAGTIHIITIKPTTEEYGWARAYGWYNTVGRSYITEILFDETYIGFAQSATNTGDSFRMSEYEGCTSITYSPVEVLPDTVTSIGVRFRQNQFYGCTSLSEIKGWKDLSIGNDMYRVFQYRDCTSNKTVKVLSNVGYSSYSDVTLDNNYVTSVSVPSDYLSNFKNTANIPRASITDSKFIGY